MKKPKSELGQGKALSRQDDQTPRAPESRLTKRVGPS
jgi:hypothetical protein